MTKRWVYGLLTTIFMVTASTTAVLVSYSTAEAQGCCDLNIPGCIGGRGVWNTHQTLCIPDQTSGCYEPPECY